VHDGLQPRFCRHILVSVQFFEALAPPGEANGAEARIAARRNDICKREIEIPQSRECRPQLPRQLLERDRAVVIERPLSDR
jgi:hypothetical protein